MVVLVGLVAVRDTGRLGVEVRAAESRRLAMPYPCNQCGAAAGERCQTVNGRDAQWPHNDRMLMGYGRTELLTLAAREFYAASLP